MTPGIKKLSAAIAMAAVLGLTAGCSQPPTAEPSDCPNGDCVAASGEPAEQSQQSDSQGEDEGGADSVPPASPEEGDFDAETTPDEQITIPWTEPGDVEIAGEPASSTDRGDVLVTGMRVAEHSDFDRVVVDLDGDYGISYRARWVDQPIEAGRGELLEVPGSQFLDVNITNARIPETDADYEIYSADYTVKSVGDISSLYDGTFEGRAHVVVGMDERRPFRIFQLESPTRLVIDIQR